VKILHLLLISLFLFPPKVFAQSAQGVFDCKVNGSTVERSEEGKYKSYSGVEGGLKVGDETTLIYKVTEKHIYIEMRRDNKKETIIINEAVGAEDSVARAKNRGIVISNDSKGRSVSLLPDYIRIKSISRELSLRRYYKSDWHGMLVEYSPVDMYIMVLGFNCRHTNDQLDKAYDIFK